LTPREQVDALTQSDGEAEKRAAQGAAQGKALSTTAAAARDATHAAHIHAGDYRAPWWLPGGHAQTILPALFSTTTAPTSPAINGFQRERAESLDSTGSPDGDFVDFDWLPTVPGAPCVVMFHGLEGSSQSHYARTLMALVAARGWNGCVPHFRGCSGEANRLPRAYHSGDSTEIAWILKHVKARIGAAPLYAAGISLGGNALAKWAGERGNDAAQLVKAVIAVSSPLDLAAAGAALGQGFNMIYTRMFLQTLKKKNDAKITRFPGMADRAAMWAARDLYVFDNIITAPLHGFKDTEDYWARASALPWLGGITVPALILNARNDPFLPAHALPKAHQVSSTVRLEQPAHGGHVGFAQGAWPFGDVLWMPRRLLSFFDSL
jgi:uncharacterized protein